MRKLVGRSVRRLGALALVGAATVVAAMAFASSASGHHISASVQLTIEELFPLPSQPDLYPILPTFSASFDGTVPAMFIDTDEFPGKVMYRFDTVIANQGGTLDIYCTTCNTSATINQAVWPGGRPATAELPSAIAAPTGGTAAINTITASSGGQGAGGWMFYYAAPGHVHWHYDRAAIYEIIVPGEATSREASKTNVGFCLFDTYDHRGATTTYFDSTGAGNPNVDPDPPNLIPDDEDWCRPGNPTPGPNGPGFVRMGISPGVGDYYASQLTDQWVDITGVPPGPVTLRATVNPDGAIIESDTTNNTVEETRIIPGTLATPASATVAAGPGGPVEIAGTIVGAEIPIYLPDAIPAPPNSRCALRLGECYAAAVANTLTFQIVNPPANGTATVVAANGLSSTVQYTPNPGYIGADSFTYTATDTRGFHSAPASATITVADVLLNLALPTVSGTPAIGQKLTASKGEWVPEPTGHSYQWQRCNAAGSSCANIGGSTDASYTLRQADGASTVRVVVTATEGSKTQSAASATTAVVSTLAQLPTTALVRTLFKGTRQADTIRTTRKHDLIKSGGGGDTIMASAGSDIVKSGNGHDLIFAGKGKDIVVAGKGNDDIRALGKMSDKINCGPGFDEVLADAIDKIHKSCEKVIQR